MSGTGVNVQLDGAGELRASTRDSVTVALWTAVSRATGLVRVAVIAAVLGPTYLGNTYQFTNSVPNLVYYGLLGGALVSSLLVPTLVKHLAAGSSDTAASASRHERRTCCEFQVTITTATRVSAAERLRTLRCRGRPPAACAG
jgi:peptidoglycan biosynthesis protein MviN/MurJ (putative lipid II flippase)